MKTTADTTATSKPAAKKNRRPGAPIGNRNAVGNRGGGAPIGNRNAVGNHGGRPRKGAEAYSVKINVAISTSQAEKLKTTAEKNGVKYTDFLRQMIDNLPG